MVIKLHVWLCPGEYYTAQALWPTICHTSDIAFKFIFSHELYMPWSSNFLCGCALGSTTPLRHCDIPSVTQTLHLSSFFPMNYTCHGHQTSYVVVPWVVLHHSGRSRSLWPTVHPSVRHTLDFAKSRSLFSFKTCARLGHMHVLQTFSSFQCCQAREVSQFKGSARSLSLAYGSLLYCFWSSGYDASTFNIFVVSSSGIPDKQWQLVTIIHGCAVK